MKKHHVIAFLLGWAFSLIWSPSHVTGLLKGKS